MKCFLMLLLLLTSVNSQASEPSDRDGLYWSAATLITLDGYSTIRALDRPDVREAGPIMNALFGEHPSDLQIGLGVSASLAMLEWSRYWPGTWGKSYKLAHIIVLPGVVYSNFRLAFD